MEPFLLTLTFQECSARYGLAPATVHEFVQAGLLRRAAAPDTVLVDEPDELPRLARLHHELGLSSEALDVVLAMRRRLVQLQRALADERARARQLEDFLRGSSPQSEW